MAIIDLVIESIFYYMFPILIRLWVVLRKDLVFNMHQALNKLMDF